MKKQPEKTALTRQIIIDSFWELASKQGIDKVSVSAITKKANLNRGTFYVYFEDINDLILQAEEDVIAELQDRIESSVRAGGLECYAIASEKMIDVFTRYNEKLFLLLGKNGDPRFISRVREIAANVFRGIFISNETNPYSDYVIAYATSAFTGLLMYWHDNGRQLSISDLTVITHRLITKGALGILHGKHLE